MLNNKRIIVVLPAYNAAQTLEKTFYEIPFDIVDDVILVDDGSSDRTIEVAEKLGIKNILIHSSNRGYGSNQKTCYNKALAMNADIIIMLHPDYQYTPRLIYAMSSIIAFDVYPVVLGSRILGKGALKGGMPIYKYISNRFLTLFQNIILNQKLSEYHTGYRAFAAHVLRSVDYMRNSDGFIFDNELLLQIFMKKFEIAEVTCPTSYAEESSNIDFRNSVKYGFGILLLSFKYCLHKLGLVETKIFK